jgi:Uma2 family endonuclease
MREPLIPQLDADEFVHWENRQAGKHELHHGFVVAFAGATVDHDTIAFNIRNALARAFPRPCRAFGPDVKVRVAETTFFYPDASVVCDDMPGNATVITAPILTCEILSESTRAYDLIDKRAAYHGVPTLRTYAIVHTRSRRIEIDSRAPSGDWRTTVFDEGEVPIGTSAISLDEIYEFTSVPAAL